MIETIYRIYVCDLNTKTPIQNRINHLEINRLPNQNIKLGKIPDNV